MSDMQLSIDTLQYWYTNQTVIHDRPSSTSFQAVLTQSCPLTHQVAILSISQSHQPGLRNPGVTSLAHNPSAFCLVNQPGLRNSGGDSSTISFCQVWGKYDCDYRFTILSARSWESRCDSFSTHSLCQV